MKKRWRALLFRIVNTFKIANDEVRSATPLPPPPSLPANFFDEVQQFLSDNAKTEYRYNSLSLLCYAVKTKDYQNII